MEILVKDYIFYFYNMVFWQNWLRVLLHTKKPQKVSQKRLEFHFLVSNFLDKCPVHYNICFSYFGQNDEKQKNQLHCLCLKMTADFRNFVAKTEEKWKAKDEMNRTYDEHFFPTLVLSQLMYLVFWYEMMLLGEHMVGGARSVRSLTVMVYRNHLL